VNRRSATIVVALLVVVVIAVGIVVQRLRSTPVADPGSAVAAPSVALATAQIGTFEARIDAHGRVGAPEGSDVHVPFAETGIIATVDVTVGQRVRTGDVLATLDTGATGLDATHARDDAQERVDAAQARLAAVRAGFSGATADLAAASATLAQSNAKGQLDRTALVRERALFAAGIAAAKDVEAAQSQLVLDRADAAAARVRGASARSAVGLALVGARADVVQAQSDLRAAVRTEHNAVLRAPSDGIVTAILKRAGESVDPTQPAVTLAAPAADTVTLTIAMAQAPGVRRGDAVTLGIPTRGIDGTGTVRDIVPSADPLTQTATVVVAGSPPGAQSGDPIDARIELSASRRRGILIPTDAIVDDPESGATIVFVRSESGAGGARFVARAVTVGAGDGASSLVTSGLRAGDRIAAHGAYDLLAPTGG
jgi:multidrug efflux pump subunit AcrA (membrane-fusion protein)